MSLGDNFLKVVRKATPSTKVRCIEMSINRQNIVDQVASLLHAWNVVGEKEEITNIQFGELFGVSDTELVPLKIYFRKEVLTKK